MAEASRDILNDINSVGKQATSMGKQVADKAADKFDKANDKLQSADWQAQLTDGYKAVQDRAREAMSTSESFVKEHPFSTVLGAAAVGFLAGLIARRRH